VGIYRTVFPMPSETFIDQQARALVRYRPIMLVRDLNGSTDIPIIALSEDRFSFLRKLFTVFPLPILYGHRNSLQDLSLIHAHFGPDAVYASVLAKSNDIPLVVTIHGYECTCTKLTLLFSGSISNIHFVLREKTLIKRASKIIAVSKFLERKLLERGYPFEKIIQHYIGVDTKRFSPISTDHNNRFILCVGRLVEKKGIDILIKAFSMIMDKHPDVTLIQIGSGPLETMLHKLAVDLGVAHRVSFLGAKPSEIVRSLMQQCEVFCLPSRTAKDGNSETLGIVFNEASACGKPVVSTLHGGIPEAVLNGETGLLVEENDHKALAEKLDFLLSNPDAAKKMGRRGREFVCDVFDLHKQTQKLELIYDDLV
jgi:colanic acid/amylovoran biosynthesis glycosyltransferase